MHTSRVQQTGITSHLDCKGERVCLEVRLDGFAYLLHKQPASICALVYKHEEAKWTVLIAALPKVRHLLGRQILEALYYSVRADQDVPWHDWLDIYKRKGELGLSERLGVVYRERSKLTGLQHTSRPSGSVQVELSQSLPVNGLDVMYLASSHGSNPTSLSS